MLSKSKTTRRAFLKGTGSIIIGLPLIEELVGEKAYAQSQNLYNYVTCFFGMGIKRGAQAIEDPVMDPIRKWYDQNKLSVMMKSLPDYIENGGGNHEGSLPHMTIAQPPFQADRIAGGESLDYLLYRMTDSKPPIDIASCGNTVLNVNDQVEFNRSYRGANRSVTPQRNPMRFYEELFGMFQPVGQAGKTPDGIIVDSVVEDYRYLMSDRAGLSGEAKSTISDTLDQVLQVQRTINDTIEAPEFAEFYANLDRSAWGDGVNNAIVSNNPEEDFNQRQGQGANHDRAWVVPLLTDIFVLGLQLGQIRFGSICLTAGAERAEFGPYPNDMHEYFHNNRSGESVSTECRWYINNFMKDNAYLLQALENAPYLDSNLLDYTAVLLTTELERHHQTDDMWFALAGGPFNHTKTRLGEPGGNGTDTDIYNTIAHGILSQENPSGYDPRTAQIIGDSRGFTGLITELLR